jgi:hypothetical protein
LFNFYSSSSLPLLHHLYQTTDIFKQQTQKKKKIIVKESQILNLWEATVAASTRLSKPLLLLLKPTEDSKLIIYKENYQST